MTRTRLRCPTGPGLASRYAVNATGRVTTVDVTTVVPPVESNAESTAGPFEDAGSFAAPKLRHRG